jgi:drug/metabolite transporter (DMT)-like permease
MKFARESFPPLSMASMRFAIAGLGMMLFMRWRGGEWPTWRQLLGGLGIGVILLGLGNGGVVLGLGYISTSLTALILASSPIWAAIFAGFWGSWPTKREVIGLIVGFTGAGVLTFDGDIQAAPFGFAMLILAAMGWAFGTVLIPRVNQAESFMGSGVQMFGASISLAIAAALSGEQFTQMPSTTSLIAFAYLVIFGSFIGFTAYAYLIPRVRPSLAISSAYVNPMVAILLGFLIAGETISSTMLIAIPLIIGGVLLMSIAKAKAKETETSA